MITRSFALGLSLVLCASIPALAADHEPPIAPGPVASATPSSSAPAPTLASPPAIPSSVVPSTPSASLALPVLHRQASDEMHTLMQSLDKPSREKIIGAYVAFDPTTTDFGAMASCDDDGDYVVVLTDAFVTLLDNVSQAEATDDAFQTRKLDGYAAFLAKSQRPNAKLLATPATFFDGTETTSPKKLEIQAVHLRESLSGVLSQEVAEMLSGTITCKHPTAAHESGDDTWTANEQHNALEMAAKAYTTPRVLAADAAGTTLMLTAGRSSEGVMAALGVFDRLERTGRDGFSPTYLRTHSGTAARMQWIEAAANNWRQGRAASR